MNVKPSRLGVLCTNKYTLYFHTHTATKKICEIHVVQTGLTHTLALGMLVNVRGRWDGNIEKDNRTGTNRSTAVQ